MITVKDLESLARFDGAAGRHILTVYLDVDQSRSPT